MDLEIGKGGVGDKVRQKGSWPVAKRMFSSGKGLGRGLTRRVWPGRTLKGPKKTTETKRNKNGGKKGNTWPKKFPKGKVGQKRPGPKVSGDQKLSVNTKRKTSSCNKRKYGTL